MRPRIALAKVLSQQNPFGLGGDWLAQPQSS
jgi:hypothetical protein